MKRRGIILWILGLSIIDQLIKVIVELRFFETTFEIIPNLIEFRPKYNMNYFYLNDVLNLGIGFAASICSMILVAVIFILLYRMLRHYSMHKRLIDWAFVFIISAFLCALVSNIFWKGVLDYIYLKPLFIFDLKDLYVWIGIAIMLTAQIKDNKSGIRITWKDVVRYFKTSDKSA